MQRDRVEPAKRIDAGSQPLNGKYEEYHPFGTTSWWATDGGTEVSAKRYRYTGKERDDETGLGYHGARYYVAWLGRWERPDPIGLKGGINRSSYVRNRPISLSDPTGHADPDIEQEVVIGMVPIVGGVHGAVQSGQSYWQAGSDLFAAASSGDGQAAFNAYVRLEVSALAVHENAAFAVMDALTLGQGTVVKGGILRLGNIAMAEGRNAVRQSGWLAVGELLDTGRGQLDLPFPERATAPRDLGGVASPHTAGSGLPDLEGFAGRANELRASIGGRFGRGEGHVGFAVGEVGGKEVNLTATSGAASPPGTVGAPTSRRFTTVPSGAMTRDFDSEVLLLEEVAKTLPADAKGRLTLALEMDPCRSCGGVISQFQDQFPNIDLEIVVFKGGGTAK